LNKAIDAVVAKVSGIPRRGAGQVHAVVGKVKIPFAGKSVGQTALVAVVALQR
jgi:hypothetical protein